MNGLRRSRTGRWKKRNAYAVEDWCFVVGNIALVILVVFWIWFMRHQQDHAWVCSLQKLTGLYCPACGGTRAFNALLHGRVLDSFKYHPLVPYAAACYGCFMISWYIQKVSGNRIRVGMRFRPLYIFIGLAILMIQWIVKNLCVIGVLTCFLARE